MQVKDDNFRTLSAKLAKHEADLVEIYCKRKGITPSKYIRDLLLREINITVPNNTAGNNILNYNKDRDTFSWEIQTDEGQVSEVIGNISPIFLEDLLKKFNAAIEHRNSAIHKKKEHSVAIPTELIRKK